MRLMLIVLRLKMLSSLNSIVGIIDMDGFMINKRLKISGCKELGIIKLGDASARSFFFDIGVQWDELSVKDKKTCQYTIWKIHKLPFGVPRGVNAKNLSALEGIVVNAYTEMRHDGRAFMAYKGGHYERDLLAKLGIPEVNLENFDCPKAEVVIKQLIWLETCGRHTVPDTYAHCPKAFEHWLQNKLLRQ